MGIRGRTQPEETSSDFGHTYSRARRALEAAVYDLISNGWQESRRRRAYDMAVALTQGAKDMGWREAEKILRPLTSLLALSAHEVIVIRQAVRDQLIELLGLLKKSPASRSA